MKDSLSPMSQALAAVIATALTLAFYVAVVYDSEHIANPDQMSAAESVHTAPAPAATSATSVTHVGRAG